MKVTLIQMWKYGVMAYESLNIGYQEVRWLSGEISTPEKEGYTREEIDAWLSGYRMRSGTKQPICPYL